MNLSLNIEIGLKIENKRNYSKVWASSLKNSDNFKMEGAQGIAKRFLLVAKVSTAAKNVHPTEDKRTKVDVIKLFLRKSRFPQN